MNSGRNKPQNDVQPLIPVASSRWTRLQAGLGQRAPCRKDTLLGNVFSMSRYLARCSTLIHQACDSLLRKW